MMMRRKWCSTWPTGWQNALTAWTWLRRLLAATALILLANGCTRPAASTPVRVPTAAATASSARSIRVLRVRVTQETGVYVLGESRLPEGACIQTALLENEQPVAWWPANVCIAPEGNQWEVLVPLGRRGAPEQLDEETMYAVQAWWPEEKDATLTVFPFDLSGPKAP